MTIENLINGVLYDEKEFLLERVLMESSIMNNSSSSSTSYSISQELSLNLTQRIAGFVSIAGGVHIFWNSWKRKDHIFHRVMLVLSIQTILWGIYNLWGPSAVPEGYESLYGAKGTTLSCSLQGFLFQTTMVIPFYYALLSCYSWAVILCEKREHDSEAGTDDATETNDEVSLVSRYLRMEKYIHLGVHVFPIGSALYLWSIEAFNPTNGLDQCWIASIPHGCGVHSGIPCERGPSNPSKILWIWSCLPAIVYLVVPTMIMTSLIYWVFQREQHQKLRQQPKLDLQDSPQKPVENNFVLSTIVAKQSLVYLGALYWTYLPFTVFNAMNALGNEEPPPYYITLWYTTVFFSQGLWWALVYWYFSIDGEELRSAKENCIDGCSTSSSLNKESKKKDTRKGWMHRTTERTSTLSSSLEISAPSATSFADSEFAAAAQSFRKSEHEVLPTQMRDVSEDFTVGSQKSSNSNKLRHKRNSFSIFDGSSPQSGGFSDFIFDGDTDDELNDRAESLHWAGCQNVNCSSGRLEPSKD